MAEHTEDAATVFVPVPRPDVRPGLGPSITPNSDHDSGTQQNAEHGTEVRRGIRRAMAIALWVWPSFILIDAYMCFVLYPSASFPRFLAYRVVIEAAVCWLVWGARRPSIPIVWLKVGQDLVFFFGCLCIALMGLELGGPQSAYMHGISLAMLVHAATIPEPWRRSVVIFSALGLVYPAVLGVAVLVAPQLGAEWLSTRSLATFASQYIFVISSSIVGLISGHIVWATERQLYRARRLGRYRLQAPIGKGGMGDVWLAWDGSLRRNVALKILRTGGAANGDSIRRFEREARSASRLRVPNTIQVYDFGASDDGIYYIAMEYLPGLDLGALVHAHGPLPPGRAIHFIQQACVSLEEAHAAGIIHRDIKPSNLFVTEIGQEKDFLKLLDFGIARFRADAGLDDHTTQTGLMSGTPAYLPPEIWQGGSADERSDIYALGATLYFLLSGNTPFVCTSPAEYMAAHIHRTPPPLWTPQGALPAGLQEIVSRCLAKRPDDRIQTVRELHQALRHVQDACPWTPRDAEAFWRAAPSRGTAVQAMATGSPTRP